MALSLMKYGARDSDLLPVTLLLLVALQSYL